jgi:hypothetical protein
MRRFVTRGLPAAAVRTPRSAPAFRMPSSADHSKIVTRRLHATAQHLKPAAALAFNADNYPMNHEKIQNIQDTPYFRDNQFLKSESTQFIELHDPATNNLVTRVPQSTDAELKAAVESAQKAFPAWRATSVMARQQIMFKFTQLIRENWDRLAASITLEQGKTFAGMCLGIGSFYTANCLEMPREMSFVVYRLRRERATFHNKWLARFWKWPRIWRPEVTESHWVLWQQFAHSVRKLSLFRYLC